jgi:hypothetical protein
MKNKHEIQILARRILEIIHFQEASKMKKITVIAQKDSSILPETADKS